MKVLMSRIMEHWINIYCVQRQVKSHAPQLKFGETTYVQSTSSYFLGQIRPGQTLSSFENNLYRSPVYPQETPPTDFLLIVAGDRVHIRRVDDIFVSGQQCPKVEVPAPNSKPAMQFQKELLQVHTHTGCFCVMCSLLCVVVTGIPLPFVP